MQPSTPGTWPRKTAWRCTLMDAGTTITACRREVSHVATGSVRNSLRETAESKWKQRRITEDVNVISSKLTASAELSDHTTDDNGKPIIPTDGPVTNRKFPHSYFHHFPVRCTRFYIQLLRVMCCIETRHVLHLCTDAGVVAGAVIAAIVIFILIVGLMYYVFSVRGYKLSTLSLPTKTTSKVDVVSHWLVS